MEKYQLRPKQASLAVVKPSLHAADAYISSPSVITGDCLACSPHRCTHCTVCKCVCVYARAGNSKSI